MNKLNNFAMGASKVLSVLMWVAVGCIVFGMIASLVGIGLLNAAIRADKIDFEALITEAKEDLEEDENEYADLVNKENFDKLVKLLKTEDILREDGTVRPTAVIFAMLDGVATCAVFALVFRYVHLILKTAKGKEWFANGETPFRPEITRMIRMIGFLLLGLAAFEVSLSTFTGVGFNMIYVIIGILMLCLSSFFRYGETLQKDADGLI